MNDVKINVWGGLDVHHWQSELSNAQISHNVIAFYYLQDYLQKFGYAAKGRSGNDFSAAVVRFQSYFHLNVTGKLDTETREEMSKPRCGNADEFEGTGRTVQAFRTGSKWRRTSLTYRFLSNSLDMSEAAMKATFRRAFKFWSDVTPLTFREVLSAGSDFTIR